MKSLSEYINESLVYEKLNNKQLKEIRTGKKLYVNLRVHESGNEPQLYMAFFDNGASRMVETELVATNHDRDINTFMDYLTNRLKSESDLFDKLGKNGDKKYYINVVNNENISDAPGMGSVTPLRLYNGMKIVPYDVDKTEEIINLLRPIYQDYEIIPTETKMMSEILCLVREVYVNKSENVVYCAITKRNDVCGVRFLKMSDKGPVMFRLVLPSNFPQDVDTLIKCFKDESFFRSPEWAFRRDELKAYLDRSTSTRGYKHWGVYDEGDLKNMRIDFRDAYDVGNKKEAEEMWDVIKKWCPGYEMRYVQIKQFEQILKDSLK